MNSNLLLKYKNGDCDISIFEDGTRIIKGNYLEYPLNIDIRVSTKCSFGQRDDGSFVLCNFCHESAKVNGADCGYEALREKLHDVPPIELAIGCNEFTDGLQRFLEWCKDRFICNLTINSGHIKRDSDKLNYAIDNKLVYGIGVSYRPKFKIPDWILDYKNCVVHVIAGIDDLDDIKMKQYNKILVLGCKDFGFNAGNVNQEKIQDWYRKIHLLFDSQVCFDNLAVEQLNIKRFFGENTWEIINQGEESFYINAVSKMFAPSSRLDKFISWDKFSVKEYYKEIKNAQN